MVEQVVFPVHRCRRRWLLLPGLTGTRGPEVVCVEEGGCELVYVRQPRRSCDVEDGDRPAILDLLEIISFGN